MNIIALGLSIVSLLVSGIMATTQQAVLFGASVFNVQQGGTGATSFSLYPLVGGSGTAAISASSSPTAVSFNATSTSRASNLPFASTTAISATSLCLSGVCTSSITTGPATSTSPLMAAYMVATSTTLASQFPFASTTAWSITSTSTGTSGINLTGGCFAVNGTCLSSSGGSGPVLIATVTATATTAYLPFNVSSTYRNYEVVMTNIVPATDGSNLRIRVSTNGGSTYQTTNYSDPVGNTNAVHTNQFDGTTDSQIQNTGGSAAVGQSGVFYVHNPSSTNMYKMFSGFAEVGSSVSGPNGIAIMDGYWGVLTAVNNIQVIMSAGNIATGTISVFGLP